MRTAIVTGVLGFVGSAVARNLTENGVEVIGVVRPESKNVRRQEVEQLKGIQLIECDLREIEKLIARIPQNAVDVFYHFAWEGLAGEDLVDYHKQILNINYTMQAIETAAKIGCQKFIGAGTISQLDMQRPNNWFPEKHGYYKHVQNACLEMGKELSNRESIEFYWPFITNIFGEGEISPRLVNTLIRKLQSNDSMTLSSGEQLYDFIHIQDAAEVFYRVGLRGKDNHQYVIGSGAPKPLKHYFAEINRIVNPDIKLVLGTAPFQGTKFSEMAFDISSVVEDTGFTPMISFDEGIRRTAEWIKNH